MKRGESKATRHKRLEHTAFLISPSTLSLSRTTLDPLFAHRYYPWCQLLASVVRPRSDRWSNRGSFSPAPTPERKDACFVFYKMGTAQRVGLQCWVFHEILYLDRSPTFLVTSSCAGNCSQVKLSRLLYHMGQNFQICCITIQRWRRFTSLRSGLLDRKMERIHEKGSPLLFKIE